MEHRRGGGDAHGLDFVVQSAGGDAEPELQRAAGAGRKGSQLRVFVRQRNGKALPRYRSGTAVVLSRQRKGCLKTEPARVLDQLRQLRGGSLGIGLLEPEQARSDLEPNFRLRALQGLDKSRQQRLAGLSGCDGGAARKRDAGWRAQERRYRRL